MPASRSLLQKCRKTGTRSTCWEIPSSISTRFADQPPNSLRARLGPAALAPASLLPGAPMDVSINAKTLF